MLLSSFRMGYFKHYFCHTKKQTKANRPVARGGVGGVPTPPSGINDIHNFNYLIQERPFDCF